MPIKLDTPAKDVDIASAEYRALLGNLQANILLVLSCPFYGGTP